MSVTAVAKKNQEEVIQLRCDEEFVERLDRHAARLKMSRSAYIRARMIEAMNREDKEARESGEKEEGQP